jgi:ribosomal RNA-processing protein 9
VHAQAHQLPVTCVAISDDGKLGFSGSKDCTVLGWDLDQGTRSIKFPGRRNTKSKKLVATDTDFNTDQVMALALSDDNQFLATGGKDRVLRIWRPATGRFVDKFKGHQGPIFGLAFQRGGSHNLFSASGDRTIKVWNVKDMAFVETLYGHEDQVYGIDSHRKERCISVGHDDTARLWKVAEEVQLILRGQSGVSIDCVAMINDQFFVTGSNDGALSLWDIGKKKPIFVVRGAHMNDDDDDDDDDEEEEGEANDEGDDKVKGQGKEDGGGGGAKQSAAKWPSTNPADSAEPRWISSVAAVRNGDVVASGSCDGFVRLWRCVLSATASDERRGLSILCKIEVPGFVNGLAFSKAGTRLLVGAGQEHRLGRWWRDATARNSVWIIDFHPPTRRGSDDDDDGDDDDDDDDEGGGEGSDEGDLRPQGRGGQHSGGRGGGGGKDGHSDSDNDDDADGSRS